MDIRISDGWGKLNFVFFHLCLCLIGGLYIQTQISYSPLLVKDPRKLNWKGRCSAQQEGRDRTNHKYKNETRIGRNWVSRPLCLHWGESAEECLEWSNAAEERKQMQKHTQPPNIFWNTMEESFNEVTTYAAPPVSYKYSWAFTPFTRNFYLSSFLVHFYKHNTIVIKKGKKIPGHRAWSHLQAPPAAVS